MRRLAERIPRLTLRQATPPLCGIGVRSGRPIAVRLLPAEPGDGLTILRTDLGLRVPLHLDFALDIPSCTAIGPEPATATLYVEHLLATFHALGVTDAGVELDGPEVPLLDGSAAPWCGLIAATGLRQLPGEVAPLVVAEPITVGDANTTLTALPPDRDGHALFRYELEYASPLIGKQTASHILAHTDAFETALAPARTFALVAEIEQARAAGVLTGGSEENCLVVYPDRYSAEPTLPDEFARHKILDMIGDLYLLGRPLWGQFVGHRTGHRQNRELLRRIAACATL